MKAHLLFIIVVSLIAGFTSAGPSDYDLVDGKNFYQILEIDKNATPDQIKRAYRIKIRLAHPDHGGTTDQSQVLNKAYGVLKDSKSRARYDSYMFSQGNKIDEIFSQFNRGYDEVKLEAFAKIIESLNIQISSFQEAGIPITPSELGYLGYKTLIEHRRSFKFGVIYPHYIFELIDKYVLTEKQNTAGSYAFRLALAGGSIHFLREIVRSDHSGSNMNAASARIKRYEHFRVIAKLKAIASPQEYAFIETVESFYQKTWRPIPVEVPESRSKAEMLTKPAPQLDNESNRASAAERSCRNFYLGR